MKYKRWDLLRHEFGLNKPTYHFAHYILKKFNIWEPPVDIETILSFMEIDLKEAESPGWLGATRSNSKNYKSIIWIKSDELKTKKRLVIAHELGHLMMHPIGNTFRDYYFKGNSQEIEANKFAVSLLAPLWMLDPIAQNLNFNIVKLSELFNVSYSVINFQLSRLSGFPVSCESLLFNNI